MARYIDADIILARLQARTKFFPYDSATEDTVNTVTYWINGELEKQKDVAPVVHAHWFETYWSGTGTECSNCGGVVSACDMDYQDVIHDFEYCPYCGAKMDEVVG